MDFDALYLRVLKYLNFRPRSEKEIRDYLKKIQRSAQDKNATDENLVDIIVHKLKQQRFLNDKEFAKMWIRSRTEFKPKGERLIRMELKQKGISKDLIDEALVSFDEDQESHAGDVRDDRVLAKELLEKKRKKYERMDSQERFNKAGSMLARRGFDLDDIKWAIDQVFGKMI